MALHARAVIGSLVDGKNDAAKLATGGAWLFAIGSLIPLLWLMSDGAADGAVFRTSVGDHTYTVPLLTYSGGVGMLLIWSEILAVAGAFILTAAPRVPIKLARIGHVVLLAWSLLWTLGTWRLSIVAPGFWTFQAMFLSMSSACTAWRAWRNWTPKNTRSIDPMPSTCAKSTEANYFSEAQPVSAPTEASSCDSTRKQIHEALERARVAAIAASRRIIVGVKAGINAARNDRAKV